MKAHNFIELTGLRFGRLVVLGQAERLRKKVPRWNCLCDCGNKAVIEGKNLRGAMSKSCGCLFLENIGFSNRTHGMTDTPEYKVWCGIKRRCYNKNEKHYPYYGGRGVKVCDQWLHSFETFFKDVGLRPNTTYSIERINVDGDYAPGNVTWIETVKQAKNKTNNVNITMNGETKILRDWASVTGLREETIKARLNRGWSAFDALTKPANPKHATRRRNNPQTAAPSL